MSHRHFTAGVCCFLPVMHSFWLSAEKEHFLSCDLEFDLGP